MYHIEEYKANQSDDTYLPLELQTIYICKNIHPRFARMARSRLRLQTESDFQLVGLRVECSLV